MRESNQRPSELLRSNFNHCPQTVGYTITDNSVPLPFPPCVPVRPLWAPSWWVLQRWLLQCRCLLLLPQQHDLSSAPSMTVDPAVMICCYKNSFNLGNELCFCYREFVSFLKVGGMREYVNKCNSKCKYINLSTQSPLLPALTTSEFLV
jgi:hypothetical protein